MAYPNFKNRPKTRLRPLGVKLKFGGGNLLLPAMTSTIEGNNSVGSLLKPLLKKVTPVVGSRMLCNPNCDWGLGDIQDLTSVEIP
jgi:hypothetical protein